MLVMCLGSLTVAVVFFQMRCLKTKAFLGEKKRDRLDSWKCREPRCNSFTCIFSAIFQITYKCGCIRDLSQENNALFVQPSSSLHLWSRGNILPAEPACRAALLSLEERCELWLSFLWHKHHCSVAWATALFLFPRNIYLLLLQSLIQI